jgi:hypothetical protein
MAGILPGRPLGPVIPSLSTHLIYVVKIPLPHGQHSSATSSNWQAILTLPPCTALFVHRDRADLRMRALDPKESVCKSRIGPPFGGPTTKTGETDDLLRHPGPPLYRPWGRSFATRNRTTLGRPRRGWLVGSRQRATSLRTKSTF